MAVLLIGAGTIVTAYVLQPTESKAQVSSLEISNLVTGVQRTALLSMTNASEGSLKIIWFATAPSTVQLYLAIGCNNESGTGCNLGTPLGSWRNQTTGSWNTTGPLVFPYLMAVRTESANGGSFSASASETISAMSTPLPALTQLFIDAAAATLLILGSIAVFLALFLRGGVYRENESLVSRSAEDAEAIADGYAVREPPRRR